MPDLRIEATPLADREGLGLAFHRGAATLCWNEVIAELRSSSAGRGALAEAIGSAPYRAVFWECAPLSRATSDTPFSAVVLDSPALSRVKADPGAFANHFRHATDGVVTFPNLGGDAILVVPIPETVPYPHLAAFLRGASPDRVDALFRAVGDAIAERLEATEAPIWVSTSGLGVYWLHVRLDARPKYYSYAPFRRFEPRRGSAPPSGTIS